MAHIERQHRTTGDLDKLPPLLLRAVIAMVLLCLAGVTAYTLSGRAPISLPPEAEVLRERTIYITGEMNGSATVRDTDGSLIADFAPDEGGFIAGVWRVLQRERINHGVALDGPVRLEWNAANRLAIVDPSTGWQADLMGFGVDNARAFGRLLAE